MKALPLNNPLTEANLYGLNSLERAFVVHEHRLLRINRYCQDQVSHLDMQFSDPKTHLGTYNMAYNHLRCLPTNSLLRMHKDQDKDKPDMGRPYFKARHV